MEEAPSKRGSSNSTRTLGILRAFLNTAVGGVFELIAMVWLTRYSGLLPHVAWPSFGLKDAERLHGFGTLIAVLIVGVWLYVVRGQSWRSVGLQRPKSWGKTALWGVGMGLFGFTLQVMLPLLLQGAGAGGSSAGSAYGPIKGNLPLLLWWLPVLWLSAGFGEEFLYRGYYFQRVISIVGERWWGIATAAIVSSLIFGLAHSYGGLNHVLGASIGGLAACAFYLILRRNLWALMIAHGLADTLDIATNFFGWV